jgi:hypothetical protein
VNERIKELGRHAMSDVMNGSDPYGDADRMYIPAEFMEKFAQLIARECAGIYDKIDNGNKHLGTDNYLLALATHFGVKK